MEKNYSYFDKDQPLVKAQAPVNPTTKDEGQRNFLADPKGIDQEEEVAPKISSQTLKRKVAPPQTAKKENWNLFENDEVAPPQTAQNPVKKEDWSLFETDKVEAKPLKQTEQVDERPIRPLQVAYQNQRDEN